MNRRSNINLKTNPWLEAHKKNTDSTKAQWKQGRAVKEQTSNAYHKRVERQQNLQSVEFEDGTTRPVTWCLERVTQTRASKIV